jgi:hypothetical protein
MLTSWTHLTIGVLACAPGVSLSSHAAAVCGWPAVRHMQQAAHGCMQACDPCTRHGHIRTLYLGSVVNRVVSVLQLLLTAGLAWLRPVCAGHLLVLLPSPRLLCAPPPLLLLQLAPPPMPSHPHPPLGLPDIERVPPRGCEPMISLPASCVLLPSGSSPPSLPTPQSSFGRLVSADGARDRHMANFDRVWGLQKRG